MTRAELVAADLTRADMTGADLRFAILNKDDPTYLIAAYLITDELPGAFYLKGRPPIGLPKEILNQLTVTEEPL